MARGRPKKAENEKCRNVVSIFLTDDEFQKLETIKEQKRISRSQTIRHLILDAAEN